jgi:hypothetical protein
VAQVGAEDLTAGRHLAFVLYDGGGEDVDQVVVRDLENGTDFIAYAGDASPVDTVLSPGAKLVGWHMYAGETMPDDAIYVRRVSEGSKTKNVLRHHPNRFGYVDAFDFSPDGKRIAFVADQTRGRPTGLFVTGVDGDNLRTLRKDVHGCIDNCGRVIWSPDGAQVAWLSLSPPEYHQRWRVFRFGSKKLGTFPETFYGWSSTGKRIGVTRHPNDEVVKWGSMRPGRAGSFTSFKRGYAYCGGGVLGVWSGDLVAMWTSEGLVVHRVTDGTEQLVEPPDACEWDLR